MVWAGGFGGTGIGCCGALPGRLCTATRPVMDTAMQIGPIGKKLLPLTVKNATSATGGHAH